MRFEVIVFLMVIMIVLLSKIMFLLYKLLEMVKPAPQTGVIKGNVSYGDASMIEGVLMTLDQAGTTVASVLTGPAGEFEFDPMAIGSYELYAHKDLPDGWLELAASPQPVEITGGEVVIADLPLVRRIYSKN